MRGLLVVGRIMFVIFLLITLALSTTLLMERLYLGRRRFLFIALPCGALISALAIAASDVNMSNVLAGPITIGQFLVILGGSVGIGIAMSSV